MIYKYYDFLGSRWSRSLLLMFVLSWHWLLRKKIALRSCKVPSLIQSFLLGGDEQTKHNYPLYPQCYIAIYSRPHIQMYTCTVLLCTQYTVLGRVSSCAFLTTQCHTGVHRLDNIMTIQIYNWSKQSVSRNL